MGGHRTWLRWKGPKLMFGHSCSVASLRFEKNVKEFRTATRNVGQLSDKRCHPRLEFRLVTRNGMVRLIGRYRENNPRQIINRSYPEVCMVLETFFPVLWCILIAFLCMVVQDSKILYSVAMRCRLFDFLHVDLQD